MRCHRKSNQVVSPEVAGCLWLTLAAVPFSLSLQPTISTEMGVLQRDVYCLLQQQLLVGPGLVDHRDLLPLDRVVVLPCMLCKGPLLLGPLLACIPVLLHPRLEHPHCLPNVLLATATGYLVYYLGPLLHHQGVLHPG